MNLEIKFYCPCGKVMIRTNETTGGYKCPDKKCWIINFDNEIWVGKPIELNIEFNIEIK